MSFIKKLWAKIPKSIKAESVSIIHTFIAAFILFIGQQVVSSGGEIEWSRDALFALIMGAIRAGVKAFWKPSK